MLIIKNLKASVNGKEILKGIDLEIGAGEVHGIMGPNGSGKSTLASVLSGKPGYEVSGEATYKGKNLLELPPEERAAEGLFLAFQYPVEIPGVSIINFLKTCINEIRQYRKTGPIPPKEFLSLIREKQELLQLDTNFINRPVNEGFSGGEKKRNEIFQMAVLEPALSILDETDSGLDIDALKIVSNGVNAMRTGNRSFLVITHYQRLLQYIVPDFIHVLSNGKIVKSGRKELALELEEKGYDWVREGRRQETGNRGK
ncbi:MAG: Fe-S cluster assembly ATPase SufC [Bacteroidetes bacterium]|nr:Fe-S cluster assembly ATPase SufC [Bacteroidota bacterium]